MTSVESGTAVNIEVQLRRRQGSCDPRGAGRTVAHMYMDDEVNAARLSDPYARQLAQGTMRRKRRDEHFLQPSVTQGSAGSSLGSTGARWREAELVFFGQELSTGVGGDIQQTTQQANYMVGMTPHGT